MSAPVAKTRERKSRIFEQHPDRWYVEPGWIWRRMFERLSLPAETRLLDPCCGRGTCVREAVLAGLQARGSDIKPRWPRHHPAGRYELRDVFEAVRSGGDVLASNPPFDLAEQIVSRAIDVFPTVCMILPATWAHGDEKGRWLEDTWLSDVLAITPRPSMLPGEGVVEGTNLKGGGTANFSMFVWQWHHDAEPRFGWLRRDAPPLTPDLAGMI